MIHMTGRLFVYMLPPVDYWHGWIPQYEWTGAVDLTEEYGFDGGEMADDLRLAERLATECGWEGDGHWRMAGLPRADVAAPTFMLAAKQQNNGTTFVVSPYELPWLAQYLELRVDRDNMARYTS
jgi:hypothetical protein